MLNHEDFEAIRQAILDADCCDSIFCDARANIAEKIADYLQTAYPFTFNRDKFME